MYIVFAIVMFAVFVVTLIDVVRRDESMIRYLPKVAWVFVVILIPLLGSILWWAVGREYSGSGLVRPSRQNIVQAPPPAVDTRSTEQQLADLEREEYAERLRAEIARRKREKGIDPAG